MTVDEKSAKFQIEYAGRIYYFCSIKMLGELHSEPDQIHKVNFPSLDVFYATQIRKCSISRKEFDAHLPGQEIAESISIRYVMAFTFEFQPQLHRTRYIF